MNRPILFTVDDDPGVLAALTRDLLARYGDRYRVLRASSGAAALQELRGHRLKGAPVALLLVDQRMPGMSGLALLREAVLLHPDVKRVLLTAYADTEAAIHAINEVGLDHYLMKPWDPPEERLFPVLDDLLGEWQARVRPPARGLRVVASRWSADGHAVRDFLVRNLVPFRWVDADGDPEADELLQAAGRGPDDLPLAVFQDGASLVRPTTPELARRVGLHTRAARKAYELVIVGSGPAGLAAAVHAASEARRTLLVERRAPGGQAGLSASIENYLGFPAGLSGAELARRGVAQARRLGAEIVTPLEATGLRSEGEYRVLTLSDGSEVSSSAVLIATGVTYRSLDVPGAERLVGSGVYFGGALTEGLAVDGQDVFVLGGGNSAGQAALHLARFARSVTLLVRKPDLGASMSGYLVARVRQAANIRVWTGCEVIGAEGEQRLQSLTLRAVETGAIRTVATASLFVFIGAKPHTDWLAGAVQRDPAGYILSGPDLRRHGRRPEGWTLPRDPLLLETSVPGVFVAGDVRHRLIKGIATAVGEGSMAGQLIHHYLGGTAPQRRPERVARAAVTS